MKNETITKEAQYEHIRKALRAGEKTIVEITDFPRSRKTLETRIRQMLSCGEIIVSGYVKRKGQRSGTSVRIYALNDGKTKPALRGEVAKEKREYRRTEAPLSVDVAATFRLLDACHAAGVRAVRGTNVCG